MRFEMDDNNSSKPCLLCGVAYNPILLITPAYEDSKAICTRCSDKFLQGYTEYLSQLSYEKALTRSSKILQEDEDYQSYIAVKNKRKTKS